jgi:hypothetical protein
VCYEDVAYYLGAAIAAPRQVGRHAQRGDGDRQILAGIEGRGGDLVDAERQHRLQDHRGDAVEQHREHEVRGAERDDHDQAVHAAVQEYPFRPDKWKQPHPDLL